MNLLILKGFNNYFNRKIKKYTDLQDYIDNSTNYYDFSDINFNPNDGVATSQVVGSENQKEIGGAEPEPLKWETEGSPDYLIAYTQETIENNVITTIHSRWFVLESVRTRNGQYQITLKRDTIADHLEAILTNPCFVEKGYVSPDNKLIFNPEGVILNQVKKGETRLYDSTGTPWICVYVAKNKPSTATTVKTYIEPDMLNQADDYDTLPWADLETFGANIPDTNVVRRFSCNGQIAIKPIVATPVADTLWSQIYAEPFRVNLMYNYDNSLSDWYFNNYNISKLGENLDRGDIGLTPTNNQLRPSDRGKIVPAYTYTRGYWGQGGGTTGGGGLIYWPAENIAPYIAQAANLTLAHSSPTAVAAIKTYLSGRKSALEAITLSSTVNNVRTFVAGPTSFKNTSEMLSYNNKLVRVGSNTYRVKVKQVSNTSGGLDTWKLEDNVIQPYSANTLARYLIQEGNYPPDMTGTFPAGTGGEFPKDFTRNTNNEMVETAFNANVVEVTYELFNREKLQFDAKKANTDAEPSNRISLNDAAYDMCILPYKAITYKVTKNDDTLTQVSSPLASLAAARALAQETVGLGTDGVYDIQLLPYCPLDAVREQMETNKDPETGETYLDLTNGANWQVGSWSGVYKVDNYGDTSDPANMQTFILWCNTAHGSFDIEHIMEMPEADSVEYKVYNECKKFRLVSPNYSSIFEFNPLKNNGVQRFNVDFNYRPYNSFIHIAPFFNEEGLYGVDTNDNRGLILQGDFSVGYYSNAWVQYQTQNANYAQIFNREIQNMDRNFKYNVAEQALSAGFDAVSNTFNSASAGSNTGNPMTDALLGTKMLGYGFKGQLFGAAADAVLTGLRYREAKSFKKDMWELQLGNVKALPNSLTKSDAITETFKEVPFIEEYDCTDIEKEMFKNKLKYDGMSVDGIATLNDYLPTGDYEFQRLKGRLVMIDNITDDFQVANDINQEVQAGFYYVPAREGD